MKQLSAKIRLIFIPYLITATLTIGVYSFLNWIFFIRSSVFIVDEIVVNSVAAAIFPVIPVLIWLRPRFKFLELKKINSNKNPLTGLTLLAWFTIIAPNIIAQEYLITKTGKLTTLTDISRINKIPHTKYYKVINTLIMKDQASKTSEQSVSGNITNI